MPALHDKTVLVIGRGSGIAHVDVPDEPSIAALAALTNGFLTGVSIPVDSGAHLV